MIGVALELLPSVASIREDGRLIDDIRVVARAGLRPRLDEFLAQALRRDRRPTYAKTLACRLFLILVELMSGILPEEPESAASGQQATEARGLEIVGWVMNHLAKSLGTRVRLDEVAAKVGVSSRHLHRLFQRHAGKSLHDYWLEYRLEHARRLFGEVGRKRQVKDIAFACGFSSLAYFSNAFRKAYGVAPSAMLSKAIPMKNRSSTTDYASLEEAGAPARSARRGR
jgi:transcriptional regulator GlxA family with amidase domain